MEMITNAKNDKKNAPPNKAYDSEYSTQFKKEMLYLRDRGIRYEIKKLVGEYQIPTYKYKKTPELFRAIADFYDQQRMSKVYEAMDAVVLASTLINDVG